MSTSSQGTALQLAGMLAGIVYRDNGKDSLAAFKSDNARFLVIVATGDEVEKLQDRICEGVPKP